MTKTCILATAIVLSVAGSYVALAQGSGAGSAQVGHSDRIGNGNTSWNSSHATTGCSQADLASWGGAGLFYCFAVN